MNLVACMLCRNEAHEIGLTARAALLWCDALVVLNHASTDETLGILTEIARDTERGRLVVLHEPDPIWYEARHRQRMLMEARALKATHVAIVDADEVLTGNLLQRIRDAAEALRPGEILQPHWTCLARSLDRWYTSGVWGDNWVSCVFRDDPQYHWTAPQGYDFHHRHPFSQRPLHTVRPFAKGDGGLMHLQFVNERRLRAKQFLYCLVERERWPRMRGPQAVSATYGRAVFESDPATTTTAAVPAGWWAYPDLMRHLRMDGPIWQEQECERMLAANPSLAHGLIDWRERRIVPA